MLGSIINSLPRLIRHKYGKFILLLGPGQPSPHGIASRPTETRSAEITQTPVHRQGGRFDDDIAPRLRAEALRKYGDSAGWTFKRGEILMMGMHTADPELTFI